MHYGLALSMRRDVDIVDVPSIAGQVRRVELTVGWQADIVVTSEAEPDDEPLEIATILALYTKATSACV